jgi:AcrR family transcriptional regulator
MAAQPDAAEKPRPPLTRERVLRAAVELADAHGILSLTMRKLGQEVGVEAMSLYNHVANKEDVLDGLVEVIVGEVIAAVDEIEPLGLQFLTELIEAGTVTPVIDRTYPLTEVPEAVGYLETGRARGKVVITV